MSGSLGCINFSSTSVYIALQMIQKQVTPVFHAIPSQYCLKCLVISLRLDVSNCGSGLAVHALEAAINLMPDEFLGASKELKSDYYQFIMNFLLSTIPKLPGTTFLAGSYLKSNMWQSQLRFDAPVSRFRSLILKKLPVIAFA